MRSFLDGGQARRGFAPLASDYNDARVLAAATAERHTVPTGAKYVVFSCTEDFYAKFGDSSVTAAVPSGDVTDGTAAELNPEAREIPSSVTHISVISTNASILTLSFFA